MNLGVIFRIFFNDVLQNSTNVDEFNQPQCPTLTMIITYKLGP